MVIVFIAQPSVGTTEAVATSKHDSIKHEGAVAPDIDLTVEPIPHEVMTSENIFLNIGMCRFCLFVIMYHICL